ncbi:hypothetical protein ACFE04_006909 [Oxalis oulophora]
MARTSNIIIGLLNAISLLVSLASISTSIYFHVNSKTTYCQQTLQTPLLITGLVLLVLSLLGLIGAISPSNNFLLGIYSFFISLVFFAVFGFTVFVLIVTSPGLDKGASKVGFRKYTLLNRVFNEKRWGQVRTCFVDFNVCRVARDDIHGDYLKIQDKNDHDDYSPLEFGCCQKPTVCRSEDQKDNTECKLWSKDPKIQCYYCNSCKNGFFETLVMKWKIFTLVNISTIVIIIFIFFLTSCAKKNNRKKKAYGYQRHREQVDRHV